MAVSVAPSRRARDWVKSPTWRIWTEMNGSAGAEDNVNYTSEALTDSLLKLLILIFKGGRGDLQGAIDISRLLDN